VTPPSDGRALEAAIPGAIFREVPGAHLSNIEEPATYNRVLLSFLQQQATGEVVNE
jgi:3-oxoadipate enol-lactonase